MKKSELRPALEAWLEDSKIDIDPPDERTLYRLFDAWKSFLDTGGLPPNVVLSNNLSPMQYGRIRIGSARPYRIELNADPQIPKRRRALALVHEMLHDYYGRKQPDHERLHTMAMGLHSSIYPRLARGGAPVTTRSTNTNMNEFLNDILNDGEDLAIIGDKKKKRGLRKIFSRKKKQPRSLIVSPAGTPRALTPSNPGLSAMNSATPLSGQFAAAASGIISRYRGWATPFLLHAYERNTQLVPLNGLSQVQPLSDTQGWRANTLESWWEQVRVMLESYTATSRSAKADLTVAVLGNGQPNAGGIVTTEVAGAAAIYSGSAANLTTVHTRAADALGMAELFGNLSGVLYTNTLSSPSGTFNGQWRATVSPFRTLGWFFRVTAARDKQSSGTFTLRCNVATQIGTGGGQAALSTTYRRDFRIQLNFNAAGHADFLFVLGDQDRGMNIPIGLDNTAFYSPTDGSSNGYLNSPFEIIGAPAGTRFDVETINYRDIVV